MPGSVWHWLLWLIVFGFPWRIARKGRGRDLAAFVFVVNVVYTCLFVLSIPASDKTETAIATLGLVGLDLAIRFASPAWRQWLLRAARARSSLVVATVLFATIVPLGLLETVCRAFTELRVLKYHQAIQTVWRSGHDDWRLATITGDENREPDPVLLWRPAAHKPFNAQRMKGPLAALPKPANVFRIMCFGDSLTDGPPKGGWPGRLQTLLEQQPPIPGRRFEVLNAGVAGYSSHQGVLRFLQEVDRFKPDLLLVSFGWNDAAEAIGQPDKTFQIPPWPVVATQRALIHYRAYLVLMYYSRAWRAQPPTVHEGPIQPRVSVDDYVANLERFRREAQSRGIPIVFLTRPHKLTADALSHDTTWRGSVPNYNTTLVAWAQYHFVPVIDVQQFFQLLPHILFSDECHLTMDGYQRMAQLIRDQLVSGEIRRAWLNRNDATPRIAAPDAPSVRY